MASRKLVNEFKKRIYCVNKGMVYDENTLFCDKVLEEEIEKSFSEIVDNEYSYYFEKCFPNAMDRNEFIKTKFQNIKSSYGYLCFANYVVNHKIKYVMTTNFDRLIEKAIRKIDDDYDLTILSDNVSPVSSSSLNIVKLHGDYNYDLLRNTEDELSNISQDLSNRIKNIPFKKIVVIGYSGQDNSVMQILKKITAENPYSEIVWYSLKNDFSEVEKINDLLVSNEMSSYCLVNGFDDLFYKLYSYEGKTNQIIDNTLFDVKNKSFPLEISN